jgi:hypothetical protein
MLRLIATCGVVALLSSPGWSADDAGAPKLGKTFNPDAIRFVSATSEDGETSVLIFDNFVLGTATGKGDLVNADTKSFSVTNKIEAKDGVTVWLDIRGFVSTEDGGSAAVLVHAGGETTLVDLGKAAAAGASKVRKEDDTLYVQAKSSAESAGFKVNARPKGGQDFYARVSVSLAKGEPLQATVVTLVDRLPNADSQALITVDSIDVSVKAAPAAKSPATTEKKAEVAKTGAKSKEATEDKDVAPRKVTAAKKKTDDKSADKKEGKTDGDGSAEKKKPVEKKDSGKKAAEKSTETKSTEK